MERKKNICVIGAGVIGLTTAVKLQEFGCRVTIIAKERGEAICSANAGAIWGPFLSKEDQRVYNWSFDTLNIFRSHSENTDSGVELVNGVLAATYETPIPEWFKLLDQNNDYDDNLPDGYVKAWRYRVPIIEMPKFLNWLTVQFFEAKGTLHNAKIDSFNEVTEEYDYIVNCSGMGARELCFDEALYPVKGQLIVVNNPGVKDFFAERGDNRNLFYWMPQGKKIVIGGTAEESYTHMGLDEVQVQRILKQARTIDARFDQVKLIDQRVGFRPCRETVRFGFDEIYTNVFHNYGHGGSGVSLSWGCAESIVKEIFLSSGNHQ